MRVRNSIEHAADADLVFRPPPKIAADLDAARRRLFDRCKVKNFILPRGHAEPREEPKARRDLLFEVESAAHLDAPRAHGGNIGRYPHGLRFGHSLVITAHEAVVRIE